MTNTTRCDGLEGRENTLDELTADEIAAAEAFQEQCERDFCATCDGFGFGCAACGGSGMKKSSGLVILTRSVAQR